MVRFALDVCMVVTHVLIDDFRCGKKEVEGIGNQITIVELIRDTKDFCFNYLEIQLQSNQLNYNFFGGFHSKNKTKSASKICSVVRCKFDYLQI